MELVLIALAVIGVVLVVRRTRGRTAEDAIHAAAAERDLQITRMRATEVYEIIEPPH